MGITLKKIFNKNNKVVIGALHFPPLLGFSDFPGYKKALTMAKKDLSAFVSGGVDGIFLENNYGLSNEKISSSQAVAMGYLCGELREQTNTPLGASVLWNDYEAAFALSHTYDLKFIRVPVFVDTVEPYCGVIKGNPKEVQKAREVHCAKNVAIFSDILVKHSKHISKHSLEVSAKKAISAGADGVIVTGNWTGESPDEKELQNLRARIGNFPILIGSGANKDNVSLLLKYADGVIVSTSLKSGSAKLKERNVMSFEQRVALKKVREFVDKAQE